MAVAEMHKEDIKAEIRKVHGSIAAFERARQLPAESVSDVLRGRSVKRTAQAIADELGVIFHGCTPNLSGKSDSSTVDANAHRLNAEAR